MCGLRSRTLSGNPLAVVRVDREDSAEVARVVTFYYNHLSILCADDTECIGPSEARPNVLGLV